MAIPVQLEYSDSDLARRIKDSDEAAFKSLYYRYYDPLFRYLWHKTYDHERTRDFVQDLFCRLWNNRANLDAGNNIKAYLYRMASNLVTDYLRQKSTEQKYREKKPKDEPVWQPDEHFDLREKAQEAIKALPEPIRAVFELSRFQGLKYTEIAVHLNLSVKTVESRMTKALKYLREALAPFLALFVIFWLR